MFTSTSFFRALACSGAMLLGATPALATGPVLQGTLNLGPVQTGQQTLDLGASLPRLPGFQLSTVSLSFSIAAHDGFESTGAPLYGDYATLDVQLGSRCQGVAGFICSDLRLTQQREAVDVFNQAWQRISARVGMVSASADNLGDRRELSRAELGRTYDGTEESYSRTVFGYEYPPDGPPVELWETQFRSYERYTQHAMSFVGQSDPTRITLSLDAGSLAALSASGLLSYELATEHAFYRPTLSLSYTGLVSSVPEPAGYALMAAGLGLLALRRRRPGRPGFSRPR